MRSLLTTLQLFHDLAAPILYHSIVVNDLPTLVKEISLYDIPSKVPRRTRDKDALVARTKHLRIVGFGPAGKPELRIQLLLRHGEWDMVGMSSDEALEFSREEAIWDLTSLEHVMEDLDADAEEMLFESPPFKSLETMVLGQRYDRGWDYLSSG